MRNCSRYVVLFILSISVMAQSLRAEDKKVPADKDLKYSEYKTKSSDKVISRSEYAEKLQGFWLGECIANWTGLRTEGRRKKAPYFTDEDWGTKQGRKNALIDFVLVEDGEVWGADDDTDIEYIYQDILDVNNVSVATPEQIREGWLKHIKDGKGNFLWVSNQRAFNLMKEGMLPPQTSLPENNTMYDQIDAQLTTEIFGLFAPTRPDVALKLAHMPIRTTAYKDAEWISEFYVIMHSLASEVDSSLPMKEQTMWLAEQARKRLPNSSYSAKIYDFIKKDYLANPDKNDWEKTRDLFSKRHMGATTDGYQFKKWFDAGINYGASLISLFYGEGDYKRTVRIGSLCGWDSDNPTATWGGLLGFMLGKEGVEKAFPDKNLSGLYLIARTRANFPDRTPGQEGDDSFELMAERGIHIIDRVVLEEMGGGVDLKNDNWIIPQMDKEVQTASIGICGSGESGKTLSISMDEYVDKMQAGWVGQMAGVGWGAPTEFKFKGIIIPEEKMPTWTPNKINQFRQDDIYVEMTFIQTLEDYGFDVSIRQAGIDFANSEYRLWHANVQGRKALRSGIAPPDSGHPQFNRCADDIDYQIEADYSGLIAPGMPQIAIELGETFGRVMNYGDGVYAGQFVGAMYSAAFFEKDRMKIIDAGYKSIPAESQYAEMIRDVLKWYKADPKNWQATWEKIEKKYHNNPEYAHQKCSGHGGEKHFSIDAKLNGAYILMGLLYGEGDIEQTIIISMRCGQDSDCNPSNASGILCTTMGLSKMPDKFKSALDMKGKFSHTRYDFPGLVDVSKKLVRQAVVRSGGTVEKDSDGKEILIIPVNKPVPTELMSVKTPGPVANSKFTKEERSKIVVSEKKAPQKNKVTMSAAVKKFADGWTIKDCGKALNPGLRAEWGGRKNVLVTHPLNKSVPCLLTKKVTVPKDKNAKLVLDVAHDPRGDWTLVVKANGKQLTKKKISKDTCKDGWTTVAVDLSAMAGQSVKLELENWADNWEYEAGYWAKIAIE